MVLRTVGERVALVDVGAMRAEPVGAHMAHAVDETNQRTLCGRDLQGLYGCDVRWRDVREFHRCPACRVLTG